MDKQEPIHYLHERAKEFLAVPTDTSRIKSDNAAHIMGCWLLTICAMVFAMVVLGGFTRLTESGLSMTDWRPVTGWLPPLSEPEWLGHFERYRLSPEYLKINRGMSLEQFKEIFWLEYLHRLWGRLIGLVFAVPFVVFLVRGWIGKALMIRLGILFALGATQGLIGWWMVKSGLVDHPDVSQYRLAIHLMTAFAILGLGFWFALDLLNSVQYGAGRTLRRLSNVSVGMVFLTAFSGALVAGLNAGLIYNTFPLMLGEVFPAEGFQMSPWYVNFFEDIPTVQFDHRWLAICTFVVIITTWFAARNAERSLRWRATVVVVLALMQVSLGVSTLLLMVPVGLAAAHQAGAVALFAGVLWLRHGMRRETDKR